MTLGLLVALAGLGAADPHALTIEVDAGARDRRDVPMSVRLPDGFKGIYFFTFESLDDRRPVPAQAEATADGAPCVVWLLRDPLPAGATRRYRLAAADRPDPPATPGRGLEFRDDPGGPRLLLDGRAVLEYRAAVAEPPDGIDRLYRRGGFIHPLATRSGLVVTDDFPPDHAHQHGLFFAWVNTTFDGRHVDFWNQQGLTGRVGRDEARPGPSFGGGPVVARLRDTLRHDDLTAPGGPAKALDETWDVRAYDVPGLVVLDLESTQTCAGPSPLKINKYHYGGLGFRGNRHWFDPTAKGDAPPDPSRSGRSEFLTSEGKHRADGNHTRPRWVDLSGESDGRFGGVAILDHPGNFRSPQPVRLHPNKPYFCFAPCVLGDFAIAPGVPYVSRYRIVVHDGPPDPTALDRLWSDYADPPRARVVDN